jgi:phage terminase large subunit-like protein
MKDKMTIQGIEVSVKKFDDEDYISLTDMLSAKDGEFFITDRLRNRNTLEYIGIWEKIHNTDFNYGEFATIRNQAGLNKFKIGVQVKKQSFGE